MAGRTRYHGRPTLRSRRRLVPLALAVVAVTAAGAAPAASDSTVPSLCQAESCPAGAAPGGRPLYGRSVTLDPTFAYYRDRTPASIATEIRANGYSIVRCVLPADSVLDPELVGAFHQEGVGVWYVTFGNGTYSTADLPDGWESWRMVTRTELAGGRLDDGFTRLCLNNADYRTWKKAQIARTLRRGRFDGVDIAEPHWPEYPGIESRAYACFCPCCREAFRAMFPQAAGLPVQIRTMWPSRWEFASRQATDALTPEIGCCIGCQSRLVFKNRKMLVAHQGPARAAPGLLNVSTTFAPLALHEVKSGNTLRKCCLGRFTGFRRAGMVPQDGMETFSCRQARVRRGLGWLTAQPPLPRSPIVAAIPLSPAGLYLGSVAVLAGD